MSGFSNPDLPDTGGCPGPLVWFTVGDPPDAAILECARCDYLIVTGTFNDDAHAQTPVLAAGT